MFYYSYSAAITGMEANLIHVEADVNEGLPFFQIVGFLSSEVKEAKERVRIAIQNSSFRFPNKKVTINLSPADIHKAGTSFDLGIAAAILCGMGVLMQEDLENVLILGELGLDGSVGRISGVLPMVLLAKERGLKTCIVPKENEREAASVEGIGVYGVAHLKQMIQVILQKDTKQMASRTQITENKNCSEKKYPDFSEVKGQYLMKRAVEIAVAGMHNILMVGSAGAGKSMVARRIPGIMPKLSKEEIMEVSRIYSIAGLLDEEHPLMLERPFRAPHHSVTATAFVGGGKYPKPGEITLADRGVLFLDELPEFSRNLIELLRQPLEERFVRISRLQASYSFPADIMLVCAMNPCLCGYFPDKTRCTCTTGQRKRYIGKISHPFLDRIDIVCEAEEVSYETLMGEQKQAETSAQIRERVEKARKIQKKRYEKSGILFNAALDSAGIEIFCVLGKEEKKLLKEMADTEGLSARACHKLLRVARTIADLEEAEKITAVHLKEAMFYRNCIEKYWSAD